MSKFLQIFGFYSLILAIAGTFGNILIIVVCFQATKNPTFSLIKYLAFSDTVKPHGAQRSYL